MSTQAKLVVLSVVLAIGVFAQTPPDTSVEKTFHFTFTETSQGVQEVVNTLRSIIEVPQASVDNTARTVTVRGSTNQLAFATWLFPELDRSVPTAPPAPGTLEYKLSGVENGVARVFFLTHDQSPQVRQEIVNGIRSIFELQRVIVLNATRAIVARGTQEQIAAAAWMIDALDRPLGTQTAPVISYAVTDHRNPAVRIFYFNPARTPQAMQELVNSIRSIGDLQRVVAFSGPKAVAVRGSAEQAAMAEWLVNAIEKPSGTSTAPYPYAGTSDVARVFYLPGTPNPQASQALLNDVRSTTKIQRATLVNAPSALVMRGTVGQIALAEQIITGKSPQ